MTTEQKIFNALDTVLGFVPRGWLIAFTMGTGSISFVTALDIMLRIFAFIVSSVVGWYAVKSYKSKIDLDHVDKQHKKVDLELKQAQLAEQLLKNKKLL